MSDRSLEQARESARLARTAGDWAALVELGGWFEQHGAYREAWSALADASSLRRRPLLPEWDGSPLDGRTLRVQRRIRHTGAELRMARLLADASHKGAAVQVVVEPRLVPLFRRSLPAVQVVTEQHVAELPAAHWGASYERLAEWLQPSAETILDGFVPLKADEAARRAWRESAGPGAGPVVGMAWHSDNRNKRLPSLDDWAGFLRDVPARFVSLQYDEDAVGRIELEQRSGRRVSGGSAFDQRQDLDGFAAQVAAVDAVVTISNTTAHMAGALGRPCIVLLDAQTGLTWPASGDRTPFYPQTRLLRATGTGWADVLRQAATWLSGPAFQASIDA